MEVEMSDENENSGESFLDHLFNAFGHLSRAKRQADAEKPERPGKKRKLKITSFDEAPAAPPAEKPCCTAKR
jgi:hypothetical protein